MALTPRSTAGRFHLELDGLPCGFLRSVEGGTVSGEVVSEPPGAEHFVKKHLGGAAPEPLVLAFGLSLAPGGVYDWIAETWDGKRAPRDGAVVFVDASLQQQKALVFERALITEVTFPALDAASKEAAYLTVTIQPERTTTAKATGKLAAPAVKAKQWLAANFRVEVDGLDCKKVVGVGAFTVESPPAASVRERRVGAEAAIDFPGLRLALPESGAATWLAWHEDFVVKGNCDDAHEKTGSLVVLDSGLKKALARIELEGLGIHRLAPERADAGSEALGRVTAELYCERMALSP